MYQGWFTDQIFIGCQADTDQMFIGSDTDPIFIACMHRSGGYRSDIH